LLHSISEVCAIGLLEEKVARQLSCILTCDHPLKLYLLVNEQDLSESILSSLPHLLDVENLSLLTEKEAVSLMNCIELAITKSDILFGPVVDALRELEQGKLE
jgi:hypothetical protein